MIRHLLRPGRAALRPRQRSAAIRVFRIAFLSRPFHNRLGMKAAVLHGKEDVRIEEIAPAELKPGEMRIQIEAALTCGTDLKVYKRGYHAKMIVPPAVFGHELAGIIDEVNPEAVGWK